MTSGLSKLVATSHHRNVFGLACLLAASISPIAAQTMSVDAHEIMKQSLIAGNINAQRSRGCAYHPSRIHVDAIHAYAQAFHLGPLQNEG